MIATAASYYAATVHDFLSATVEQVSGALMKNSAYSIETSQRDAWLTQTPMLKSALKGLEGTIYLEFSVPRIGSRIDAVFISGPVVFVIEFKVGETDFQCADLNQVWDYALDLKNFHKGSHHAAIVPILVATSVQHSDSSLPKSHEDKVFPPVRCGRSGLGEIIRMGLQQTTGQALDPEAWLKSPYQPTPTIIQAAQSLYSNHSVEAIARHDAGARNLKITSGRIEQLIDEAQKAKRKTIIFVTGVPGAGKTLVGLNVATKKRDQTKLTHAVFLSGNGPLVKVLTEALARDEVYRLRKIADKTRKGVVKQKIKAFIQNVHHFRDAALRDEAPPSDRVVIFDEAQRAWDLQMTADFMLRKKRRHGFKQSEPEFLISYLDRHQDWAVIVCLVGGGQEINRGEAGISAWLDAVRTAYPEWFVCISSELKDSEYAAGQALASLAGRTNLISDDSLHLAVSMRSFRAENVSTFVKSVLDLEIESARKIFGELSPRYPMAVTRDIAKAKDWIRLHARGSQRYGLVASSGAQRLKPHAIDVRVEIDPVHWFLNDSDDTRSSYYLEDAATEFQVQGLELDWVCVNWDADLRFTESCWQYHSFVGSKWQSVKKPERQQFLRNAYRVLLTRARQGMVIFVPRGDNTDPTRPPAFYNPTFNYLEELGIPVI